MTLYKITYQNRIYYRRAIDEQKAINNFCFELKTSKFQFKIQKA